MSNRNNNSSYSKWVRDPQTMIGLPAALLSVCGLFISFYEASIMRENQRASVWPHVQVVPSIDRDGTSKSIEIFTENAGVGPAKIEAAKLSYNGNIISSWSSLMEKMGGNMADINPTISAINGRVLPVNSNRESLFYLEADSTEKNEQELILKLSQKILDGEINVSVCYCSVFEKCWITSMEKVIQRFKNSDGTIEVVQNVESCKEIEVSGI